MKGNILLFILLFLITLSSFPQVKVKKKIIAPKTAFELNETAIILFQNYSFDQDSIRKSIRLLDKAIALDSTYFTAYINKVSLLCNLGENTELLDELAAAMKLHEKDPQLTCMQAYVLEKSGQKAEAMLKYKEADVLFADLIKANQNFLINKIGKAFLQLFLKNKKEGIKQYNEIARLYKNKEVALMKNAFYSFNREEFIKSYCIPPQPLQSGPEITLNQIRK
jgi:tetratricopeptide (TPR) repeat protein